MTSSHISNRTNVGMESRNGQRSLSMPKLTNVEAVRTFQSKTFLSQEVFTIEEKEAQSEAKIEVKHEAEDTKRGRRKFGVFLTGAALGGIASTFCTYGQLKQQQVLNIGWAEKFEIAKFEKSGGKIRIDTS